MTKADGVWSSVGATDGLGAAACARGQRLLLQGRHQHGGRVRRPFLEARQKFIRPHCPWQNGKVERLNRTLATEWAYRRPWTSNDERTAALAGWIDHYNTERHHSALGCEPPISGLAPT